MVDTSSDATIILHSEIIIEEDTMDFSCLLISESSYSVYLSEEEKIKEYILKMRNIDKKFPDYSHNKPPLHWKDWRSRR